MASQETVVKTEEPGKTGEAADTATVAATTATTTATAATTTATAATTTATNDTKKAPEAKTDSNTAVRTDRPIVIDATNHIAGRLASNVAKLLIKGNRVSVVNCEKIMMSGTKSNQIKEYREFLEINSIINPKHGPDHYRRPDTVMAKMIRGMLPYNKKPSGKQARQRLRTYIGSPKELKSIPKIQFEKAKIKKTPSNYTTIGEICKVIGWTR